MRLGYKNLEHENVVGEKERRHYLLIVLVSGRAKDCGVVEAVLESLVEGCECVWGIETAAAEMGRCVSGCVWVSTEEK